MFASGSFYPSKLYRFVAPKWSRQNGVAKRPCFGLQPCTLQKRSTYENGDETHSLVVKLINELGQARKVDFVVSEILLRLHMVNVAILNIL